ncbi:putative bifunctional diguanylate cyclase/phosphodiesterase [Pseudoalteromonas fenneropenaei]|uniref:Bifunctional diguanylate cyclase/phosphodiesterase n=1 Tax=Pseudoalteromonas fenneropenaei TaxID=1737459 RepID=A0ABV7CML8_9GAMM
MPNRRLYFTAILLLILGSSAAFWLLLMLVISRAGLPINHDVLVAIELNQPIETYAWLTTLFGGNTVFSADQHLYLEVSSNALQINAITLTSLILQVFEYTSFWLIIAVNFMLAWLWRTHMQQNWQEQPLVAALLQQVQQIVFKLGGRSPIAVKTTAFAALEDNVVLLKEHAEQLQHCQALSVYQDKLTQLIDRHAYIKHLEQQLRIAEANHSSCALLFIDLDGFKQVNDSFGHSFGDEVLIQVAARLLHLVSVYDLSSAASQNFPQQLECNLARLGGDEFSLFIANADDSDFCIQVAQNILNDIEKDFVLGNKLVKISASIGIAVYPDSAANPQALLQMADVAMYRAKADGRGIFRVYSPEMGSKLRRYHYLLEELRLAIAAQSFYLSFQPIVHVEDCAIDYFEALIRWQHPIEGAIPPSEFIPIAEETNLILSLGDWIIEESCRQMAAWHKAGMKKVKVSVNVSGVQLKHREIFTWVQAALHTTSLPASALMLEITESTLITASKQIIEELERCRQIGVTIAIDDFGTGFSSLSTLADLPIDVIKIDKQFIAQARDNPKYHKILNSISELGKQLGLKIVAEGVERIDQFELVKNIGISCVQGYLVSRPQSPSKVGHKVLNGNVNHIASTGTSVWLPQS